MRSNHYQELTPVTIPPIYSCTTEPEENRSQEIRSADAADPSQKMFLKWIASGSLIY